MATDAGGTKSAGKMVDAAEAEALRELLFDKGIVAREEFGAKVRAIFVEALPGMRAAMIAEAEQDDKEAHERGVERMLDMLKSPTLPAQRRARIEHQLSRPPSTDHANIAAEMVRELSTAIDAEVNRRWP
jgi:hypothetical protein